MAAHVEDSPVSTRFRVPAGGAWGDIVGYSRVVAVGNQAFVAGTTATDAAGIVGKGDMYQQTRHVLIKIAAALHAAGFSMEHVVRTRMFVIDISRWEEVARAHAEVFGDIKPVASMLQVSALIDPELMIEIECDAVK